MNKDLIDTKVMLKYLELGIIPYNIMITSRSRPDDTAHDPFKDIEPVEARRMKRKFRKLKRKAYKKYQMNVRYFKTKNTKRDNSIVRSYIIRQLF